jgi:hypothetical protein
MKTCPYCGYTDDYDRQLGGCFDCMREGCEVCLPRKYRGSDHSCPGCGPIIKRSGIKRMLDLWCEKCAGTPGERGIVWVKTHSVVAPGEGSKPQALCNNCWDEYAKELERWYKARHAQS